MIKQVVSQGVKTSPRVYASYIVKRCPDMVLDRFCEEQSFGYATPYVKIWPVSHGLVFEFCLRTKTDKQMEANAIPLPAPLGE